MSYNFIFTLSFISFCLPFSRFPWRSELRGVLLMLLLVGGGVCRPSSRVCFILSVVCEYDTLSRCTY